MSLKSYDLKRRAKEQLSGKWLQAGLVCFIAWVVTMSFNGGNAVNSFQNVWQNGELVRVQTTNSSSGLGSLVNFVLSGPITLGVTCYFLKLIRNEGPIIENMFSGFKFFIKSFIALSVCKPAPDRTTRLPTDSVFLLHGNRLICSPTQSTR